MAEIDSFNYNSYCQYGPPPEDSPWITCPATVTEYDVWKRSWCDDVNHGRAWNRDRNRLWLNSEAKSAGYLDGRNPIGFTDIGDPLDIRHISADFVPSQTVSLKDGWRRFDGRLYPKDLFTWKSPSSVFKTWADPSRPYPDISLLGAEAYERFKPGRPVVDLGVFLGEITEAPKLLRFKVGQLKDMGRNHLNITFGWAPVLRDLVALYTKQQKFAKRLAQLKRDNGKPIRRRGIIREIDTKIVQPWTSWTADYSSFSPPFTTGFYSGVPSRRNRRRVSAQIAFAGQFRYWIPDMGSDQWSRRAKRELLGLTLTPKLAWELLPWSWLIDWFTNLGDIISNMSSNAAETMISDYAYLTGHQTYWYERECRGSFNAFEGGTIDCTASITLKKEWKERVKATPFGFDMGLPDLTATQIGILAALGLTLT